MTSKLDQLRTMTTVVADTGDVAAVRQHKPVDCTTNPTIVLKALQSPDFTEIIAREIRDGRNEGATEEQRIRSVASRLAIAVGAALAAEVPGHVSTEVDADLSFDVQGSVASARRIIKAYEARGVGRDRILIKLASTWEGIEAARVLQHDGIDCNMTLIFSLAQAIACADAGAFLISPFVGRILDWHTVHEGRRFAPAEDPGVLSVRQIYEYYKANEISTIVMGASFRNIGEIEELAGCDKLTISPALLDQLARDDDPLQRRLSPSSAPKLARIEMNERRFRWEMNESAMATEKLAEGIRQFGQDLRALRTMVRDQLYETA